MHVITIASTSRDLLLNCNASTFYVLIIEYLYYLVKLPQHAASLDTLYAVATAPVPVHNIATAWHKCQATAPVPVMLARRQGRLLSHNHIHSCKFHWLNNDIKENKLATLVLEAISLASQIP